MINITDFCDFDHKRLPEDIQIATMTVHCKVKEIAINFDNIFDYIEPSMNDICYMEYKGKIKKTNDILIHKSRTKKKSTFQNSMSLYVIGTKRLHINFFKNGTLHITGVKNIYNIESVLNNLFLRLKRDNDLYNYYDSDLVLDSLKINMINTNVSLKYKLNKLLFREVLWEENIECVFNKTQNISLKYKKNDKTITIIIHMSSIIISRCTTEDDIIQAYHYITNLLNRIKYRIMYIEVDEVLSRNNNLKKMILQA